MCSQRTPKTRSDTLVGDMAEAAYWIVRNNLVRRQSTVDSQARRSRRRRQISRPTIGSTAMASPRIQGSLPAVFFAAPTLRARVSGVSRGAGFGATGATVLGFVFVLGLAAFACRF